MYVLTLAMLVEGSHRILDSRNMVLITGKAFTILGLVVKWSDLRIQRCTAMNAGSATGSHGARYIRVQRIRISYLPRGLLVVLVVYLGGKDCTDEVTVTIVMTAKD